MLFVFAGDPQLADSVPLSLVPPLQEPGWLVQDTFRDLPFIHHLTGADASGFSVTWPEGPRRDRLGSMTGGFGRILTVVYATPIRPGECRLFARFPFQFRSRWPRLLLGLRPRWLQHLADHSVREDDQVFLHWPDLHRWVGDHGGEPFPGHPCHPTRR